MCQGKNHYTRTSIDKIRENLEKYHKIHVERRWIFYCLAEILSAGYITRKARYRNDEAGLIRQYTSLLAITIKGMKYLVAKRVSGAWKLLKSMMAWLKKKDGRWPVKKDVQDPEQENWFSPSKDDWSKLLGIAGKKIE
jgi:hypothetical protein